MKRQRGDAEESAAAERVRIVHLSSEHNDRDEWTELEFAPSPAERLLLDLYAHGSPFRPTYEGGPHGAYALASYLVWAHGKGASWHKGDPTDKYEDEVCDFLRSIKCDEGRGGPDEELAEAVRAAVRRRARAFKTGARWCVRTPVLEPSFEWCSHILDDYVEYLRDLAADKDCGCDDLARAEETFREHPEWREAILRLEERAEEEPLGYVLRDEKTA